MIPIYRAKKIDTDEWVEGSLITYAFEIAQIHNSNTKVCKSIETNTLAIHFPNMIDKNGKKIFASLSKDGVGGDIVSSYEAEPIVFDDINLTKWEELAVIGIHKGD